METILRPHAQNIVSWSKNRPEVLVLSGDLTTSCEVDLFREAFPDRFFGMGMAEQNMLGFAAGLAREGFVPFVHSFAVFLYRRAFDQLAMSIAYSNLKVRLMGFLPGITTPGGVSHQAIDDLALMRSLPNMTVIECGDATEVETILTLSEEISGPLYVRMVRGEVPRVFDKSRPILLDHARILHSGSDVTLLSSGICTPEAMRAVAYLEQQGISIKHLHVSCLKPFHDQQVIEALAASKLGVVTVENHSIMGGLGTAVAELMAEKGISKRLIRLGLQDTFAHGASRGYLMKEYKIDGLSIVKAVCEILGVEIPKDDVDLLLIDISSYKGESRSEAL
jgi:transketolase